MKLTIELVPQTCWYSNVRSNVTKKDWDIIRKKCYSNANYKCEICGGVGKTHPVECHEIWEYDDTNLTQKLIGLISLCPTCHKVKHIGLARINGEDQICINQLMKVNKWDRTTTLLHIDEAFKLWEFRSQSKWILNIDFLKTYL